MRASSEGPDELNRLGDDVFTINDGVESLSSAFPPGNGKRRRIRNALLALGVVAVLAAAMAYVQVRAIERDLKRARATIRSVSSLILDGQVLAAQDRILRAHGEARSADGSSHGGALALLRPLPWLGRQVGALQSITRSTTMSSAALLALVDDPTTRSLVGDYRRLRGEASLDRMVERVRPAVPALVGIERRLAEAEKVIDRVPRSRLVGSLDRAATLLRSEIANLRRQLAVTLGLFRFGDRLIDPAASPLRLLLLSQNTWELRPSGGFIGSFGELEIHKGVVRLVKYDDATALPDPEPPMYPTEPLKSALAHPWDLTGVGWWADFPTSAKAAQTMYQRVGGRPVDGVLGVTNEFLTDLLSGLGPVRVPGYQDVITADNVEERILHHVELKRPFDKPRKKFLNLLTEVVFSRLSEAKGSDVESIVKALGVAVKARDAQFYFNDLDAQRTFRIAGWDGALILPAARTDFLSLVDANFGSDKANRWIRKQITYRTYWNSFGEPMAELTVETRNTGHESIINPRYVSNMRVYVRPGIDWRPATRTERATTKTRLEDGFTVMGRDQVIEPMSAGIRTFRYRLPDSVVSGEDYTLMVRPQAGTPHDRFEIVNELGEKRQTVSFGAREGDKTLTLDLVRPEDRGNVFKRLWRKYRGWLRR